MRLQSRTEKLVRRARRPLAAPFGSAGSAGSVGVVVTLLVGLATVTVAHADVQERQHRSSLEITLLGLPKITMQAKPDAKISVNTESGAILLPASLFEYQGTLVPDFDQMNFKFDQRTNLDTRLLQSVQVSVRNRAGSLRRSAYQPTDNRNEFGGNFPLTGDIRLKFKPYIKKEGGKLVTKVPEDVTLPAWMFGQRRGHADIGNGVPPDNTAMRIFYLGAPWRDGRATTFRGSVTASQLDTQTPGGAEGVIFDQYQAPANGHLNWNLLGLVGDKMFWNDDIDGNFNDGDTDGYGYVKVVTPVAVHHLELQDQLQRPTGRFYTLPSHAQMTIEVLPVDLGLSLAPERGLPTLMAAVGLAAVGVARRRAGS